MEQKKGLRAQIPLSLHTQANKAAGRREHFRRFPPLFYLKICVSYFQKAILVL
nr:hypothetical protein [uncultured Oscillibacter sp.]